MKPSGTNSVKPPVSFCRLRSRSMWPATCSGFSMWPYMMVALERRPTECAALTISTQRAVISFFGESTSRTLSSRISAAVPGIVPSPASLSQSRYSRSGIPLFFWPKSISSGE